MCDFALTTVGVELDIQKHFSYRTRMRKALADLLHRIMNVQKNRMQRFRETGAALSPFNYGITRLDERGACAILADLFSPAGSHHQGTLFLNQFLCKLGIANNFESLENGVAITEKYTNEDNSKRYLDIFIDCDELKIGIECKFYAEDQYLQLASYLDWLRHISGKNAYYLIYLTPDGHAPSEDTLPITKRKKHEGHFLAMSWPDMLTCLEATATDAPEIPNKIRYFVHDYCSAIKKYKFGEDVMARTEHKEIAQMIEKETNDSEFLAAFSMRFCYDDIIKAIYTSWKENLVTELKKAGCAGKIEDFDFLKYNNPDCAYAIKVHYPDYLTVGIYRETENTPIYLSIWAKTWEYYPQGQSDNDVALIRALKDKYRTAVLENNNITSFCMEIARSDDPKLLLKMRKTDPVYLANDLIGLCKIVENTARELGIEL